MAKLLEFHKEKQDASFVSRHHKRYLWDRSLLKTTCSIEKKNPFNVFINAGIYVLNLRSWLYTSQSFFDIPDLIKKLLEEGKVIKVFPIREYWIDIGRLDEYERANHEFNEVFA